MSSDVYYITAMDHEARAAGWYGPGWYFWDETGAYCHGPFGSREEAEEALERYAESLEISR